MQLACKIQVVLFNYRYLKMNKRMKLVSWLFSFVIASLSIYLSPYLNQALSNPLHIFLMVSLCIYPLILNKIYKGQLDWRLKNKLYPDNNEQLFKQVIIQEKQLINRISFFTFIIVAGIVLFIPMELMLFLVAWSFTRQLVSSE